MSTPDDSQRTASMPLIGDEFPQMEVQTSQGTVTLPDDYEGQWFVLFSHPGDFTPVCTTEFVSFEQHREQFEERGAQLVGLSVDRVHSHIKWTDWIEENLDVDVGFPIVADETGRVAKRLGMIHPGESTSTVRSVFIVNPEGVVRLILYYPLDVGRNIDEILRALEGLQTSAEEGFATPADWPDNETFGDRVLLPPPSTEADAKARREEAEGDDSLEYYDWWFTMKQR